ncbi:hypothetical protein AVEN_192148-1 [Araneus ventricosus]|uniref:Uncharacterized protein n=1 Tax=Araneus ventricosus TaxID=182803 RepID=A0A4Y2LI34_ARAVE|nr:hypothetical protein AVEN_192148-1 [Araneus ventricosus]
MPILHLIALQCGDQRCGNRRIPGAYVDVRMERSVTLRISVKPDIHDKALPIHLEGFSEDCFHFHPWPNGKRKTLDIQTFPWPRPMDLMHVTSHPPTRDLPEAAIGQS